jgi:hypothetical protein
VGQVGASRSVENSGHRQLGVGAGTANQSQNLRRHRFNEAGVDLVTKSSRGNPRFVKLTPANYPILRFGQVDDDLARFVHPHNLT